MGRPSHVSLLHYCFCNRFDRKIVFHPIYFHIALYCHRHEMATKQSTMQITTSFYNDADILITKSTGTDIIASVSSFYCEQSQMEKHDEAASIAY